MKINKRFLVIILCVIFFIGLAIFIVKQTNSNTHVSHESHETKKERYHCPMHPTYISDKPGDCPICGMRLVPIEEEGQKESNKTQGEIKIDATKQQLIGVKKEKVQIRKLDKIIRTVGKVNYNETKLVIVNTKISGWIEKIFLDYTGKFVKKGEPLVAIYSPDLVSTQEEYLIAMKNNSENDALTLSIKNRLALWDIKETDIKKLEKTGQIMKTMIIYSPIDGFVMEKDVLQGKYIMQGEMLYKVADLRTVWITANFYEYEIPYLKTGQNVELNLSYYPGEKFIGKINYVYPYLEPETRTIQARLEFKNPDYKLKPEMFANVELHISLGNVLALSEEAVIDSGTKKIVFVDNGDGYFAPREITLGEKVEDYYVIKEGLTEGEIVVTSGNFLIDSESKLKSALGQMKEHEHE
jgi:RND family efflux transporter MFP subunit